MPLFIMLTRINFGNDMGNIVVKEWEGEAIAGRDENWIREHYRLEPRDKVYLIYIGDRLVYFQYLMPFVQDKIKLNKANIAQAMKEHYQRLVNRLNGENNNALGKESQFISRQTKSWMRCSQ